MMEWTAWQLVKFGFFFVTGAGLAVLAYAGGTILAIVLFGITQAWITGRRRGREIREVVKKKWGERDE